MFWHDTSSDDMWLGERDHIRLYRLRPTLFVLIRHGFELHRSADVQLPPSIIKLRSRTDDGCSDCMRRCAGPLPVALSGETSGVRFVSG